MRYAEIISETPIDDDEDDAPKPLAQVVISAQAQADLEQIEQWLSQPGSGNRAARPHEADDNTMTKDVIPEDVAVPAQTPRAEPTPVTGPIIGIPWAEVRTWMQSWGTGRKATPPKPRRIE